MTEMMRAADGTVVGGMNADPRGRSQVPRAAIGEPWLDHDERYRGSEEFIRVLRGIWAEGHFTFPVLGFLQFQQEVAFFGNHVIPLVRALEAERELAVAAA